MVLNETGAYIFEALQEEKDFEELVSCIYGGIWGSFDVAKVILVTFGGTQDLRYSYGGGIKCTKKEYL